MFKDYVNEGKVPAENFVVSKEQSIDPSKDLKDGQIFVEVLYISVDPYMRARMQQTKASAAVMHTHQVTPAVAKLPMPQAACLIFTRNTTIYILCQHKCENVQK